MKALQIVNLKKQYRGGLHALKGIDIEVEQGDFFALLGPNGAGKSTAIGIIVSLIQKTSGKVHIFGLDSDTHNIEAKSLIGFVPQEMNFSQFEKPLEILINQGGFYGINRKTAYERAKKYLCNMSLWDKRNDVSRTLSGGMKRRLMIARALIHEPKLLFLDEPTAGVDVESRRAMWDFLTQINHQGTTIVLTTHYLEEAENLCKNIAIIDGGKIIENTTIKSLLSNSNKGTFVLDLKKAPADKLQLHDYSYDLIDTSTLQVDISKEQNLNDLFQQLSEQKIEVTSMRNKSNRLEEFFISILEKNKHNKKS